MKQGVLQEEEEPFEEEELDHHRQRDEDDDSSMPLIVALRIRGPPQPCCPDVLVWDPSLSRVFLLPDQSPMSPNSGYSGMTHVLDGSAGQEQTYSQCVAGFVHLILDGYDLSVIGAGAPGSGKSHSLLGTGASQDAPGVPDSDAGILQRTVRDIFEVRLL